MRTSNSQSRSGPVLDRRSVVLAGTALLGMAALPDGRRSRRAPGLPRPPISWPATRKFLSSLEPDQRKAASFAWNGPEWSGWNYFGSPATSSRACGWSR